MFLIQVFLGQTLIKNIKSKPTQGQVYGHETYPHRSGVVLNNFEQISQIVLVFSLLTLKKQTLAEKWTLTVL